MPGAGAKLTQQSVHWSTATFCLGIGVRENYKQNKKDDTRHVSTKTSQQTQSRKKT